VRSEYGGLKSDQVKWLKELKRENARLRRAVSDLTLEKLSSRSWHAWHSHASLLMLPFAMMVVMGQRANNPELTQHRNVEARRQR
jgi:SRSO17 transposase